MLPCNFEDPPYTKMEKYTISVLHNVEPIRINKRNSNTGKDPKAGREILLNTKS